MVAAFWLLRPVAEGCGLLIATWRYAPSPAPPNFEDIAIAIANAIRAFNAALATPMVPETHPAMPNTQEGNVVAPAISILRTQHYGPNQSRHRQASSAPN
ncbi:predicted protein [Uncinocarpus reesii 1704]|uniref:Uncharacterized protein n=1 Tax=Uncinocarpus reesii (strain UAMH 1704) TaxID=336963 RepID=C4JS04_UNCRE|nr:uncharacterized protein UREG_05243 [Uncinocarpus reesii 1704]EEP80401.1 predicted protein [Uncinocarpus reesii 1704]